MRAFRPFLPSRPYYLHYISLGHKLMRAISGGCCPHSQSVRVISAKCEFTMNQRSSESCRLETSNGWHKTLIRRYSSDTYSDGRGLVQQRLLREPDLIECHTRFMRVRRSLRCRRTDSGRGLQEMKPSFLRQPRYATCVFRVAQDGMPLLFPRVK